MFPGAGFLYTRDPAHFAVTAAAFALAVVLWFGTGNHIAPPLIWLGGAASLAARVPGGKSKHWRGAPYVVAALARRAGLRAAARAPQALPAQQEQAKAANELLRVAVPPLRGADRPDVHVAERDGRRGRWR